MSLLLTKISEISAMLRFANADKLRLDIIDHLSLMMLLIWSEFIWGKKAFGLSTSNYTSNGLVDFAMLGLAELDILGKYIFSILVHNKVDGFVKSCQE